MAPFHGFKVAPTKLPLIAAGRGPRPQGDTGTRHPHSPIPRVASATLQPKRHNLRLTEVKPQTPTQRDFVQDRPRTLKSVRVTQGMAEECSGPMETKQTGRLSSACRLGWIWSPQRALAGQPKSLEVWSDGQTAATPPGTQGEALREGIPVWGAAGPCVGAPCPMLGTGGTPCTTRASFQGAGPPGASVRGPGGRPEGTQQHTWSLCCDSKPQGKELSLPRPSPRRPGDTGVLLQRPGKRHQEGSSPALETGRPVSCR